MLVTQLEKLGFRPSMLLFKLAAAGQKNSEYLFKSSQDPLKLLFFFVVVAFREELTKFYKEKIPLNRVRAKFNKLLFYSFRLPTKA